MVTKLKKIENDKNLSETARKEAVLGLASGLGVPTAVLRTLDVKKFLKDYYALDEHGFSKGLSRGSILATIPGDPFGVKAFHDAKKEYLKPKTNFQTRIRLLGPALATAATKSPDKALLAASPSGKLKAHISGDTLYSFKF